MSQTAPYHHFADKRALLGALAADGFRQLTAALLLEPSREKTFNRHIKSLCAGLMHFASEKPELFKLRYSGQRTPIEGHDEAVSYTHLDVYKRQARSSPASPRHSLWASTALPRTTSPRP